MSTFHFNRFVFLLASALCLAVTVDADSRTVRIGIITDLTGVGAFYGEQTRIGALIAEQEINSGAQQAVTVTIEDSGLKASQGLSAAHRLLHIEKVDALYTDFTPISVAVSPLAKSQNRLLVYAAGGESILTENPHAFKTFTNFRQSCEALAREFQLRGVSKLGLLTPEIESGTLCAQGVRRVFPQPIEATFRVNEPLNTQVLTLKHKGAQAFINSSYEADLLNTLQAARSIQFEAPIGGVGWCFNIPAIRDFKRNMLGALAFSLQDVPEELKARARSVRGGERLQIFEGTGLAYLHVHQIYSAILKCPNREIDCITSALAKSPRDDRFGFEGWKNRVAQLRTTVSEYKADGLTFVRTYLSAD
jgi:ABC-type branched-subunit amino acid transport system substrate-binding protein